MPDEPFGELLDPNEKLLFDNPFQKPAPKTGGYLSLRHSLEIPQADQDRLQSGDPNFRPEAIARQELLQQLDAASHLLETQLAQLRRGDSTQTSQALIGNGSAILLQLNALRDQLVSGATDVTALRAGIASAIADIRAYTSDARAAATGQSADQTGVALRDASNAARQSVADFERDFYGRRIFDPYLRFASAEDEDAYRRREEERQRAIDKALAEASPEGNLRANGLAIEQLRDAGAHGADRSPEFNRWRTELLGREHRLKQAIDGTQLTAVTAARADARDSQAPDAKVSPDLLAAFRQSGTAVADQTGAGHGLNIKAPPTDRSTTPG